MFFKLPKPKPKSNYSKIGNKNLNTDFFLDRYFCSSRSGPVTSFYENYHR